MTTPRQRPALAEHSLAPYVGHPVIRNSPGAGKADVYAVLAGAVGTDPVGVVV